jgi:hypothetical protein
MFHELLTLLPSSVWRQYEPGPVTFAIEKGPSHGELSLCSPFVFWMRRRTRSPTLKERSLTLRLDEDDIVSFFKSININSFVFFRDAFVVLLYCRRFPHDVGRYDSLGVVDQEVG